MDMNRYLCLVLVLTGLVLISACSGETEQTADEQDENNIYGDLAFDPDNGGLTLPEGFQAVVVAEDIGRARHLTVHENGTVYVALSEESEGGGVAALRDNDDDGVADEVEYFGGYTGTGIAIHNGYLYRSSDNDAQVFRYPLSGDELVPDTAAIETVVAELPEQSSHAAKSIAFDGAGNLYVNIGGPSNACQEQARTPGSPGQEPCPQLERQGGTWQFSDSELNQTQDEHGTRYASGIRNGVALAWNTHAGSLYIVQHGRDQLSSLWPDLYTDEESAELPAEEFLKAEEGSVFGWPYTYYDHLQDKRVVSPEYGGDGEQEPEEDYPDPIYTFPGHWAPNALTFYTGNQFPEAYHNGAFIAFHGSWNRAPMNQEGYRVIFVSFNGDMPSGDHENFAMGFPGVDEFTSPGDAEHRPTGLAVGPDGSLYISDSVTGKIWRIVYTGA